jgi:hypothetical protein
MQSIVKEAGNVTFSRSDLAQFLINEARSKYPDSIRFHFERGVESINLEKKQVGAHVPLLLFLSR